MEIAAFLKKPMLKNYHIDFKEKITYDEFLTNKMPIIAAIKCPDKPQPQRIY